MLAAWRRSCASCIIALLLARALPASAEPAEAKAPAAALEHYRRGKALFRAGRYSAAIVELKAALRLDPKSPNLMYNVAYTSELLGDLSQAITYYRRYLGALPASEKPERQQIQETLRRLEGHRRQVAAGAEQRPGGLKAPSLVALGDDSIGRADTWFWLSLGTGAALLAAGGVTGVMALDRENEVAGFVAGEGADGSVADRQQLIDEANNFALASDALLVGGGALVVGAAALFFLRDPEHAPPARPAVSTDGKSAVLSLRLAF